MAFFGLTQNDRVSIFRQIHEIVFFGKGGYSWQDVYQMPIWLRNYTFSTIFEYYEEEGKATKAPEIDTKPKGPNIDPTYTSKASTK